MSAEYPKPSIGLKFAYAVAAILIVSFIGFLGLLCFLDTRDFFTPSEKLAAKSPLIILTRVDTNAPAPCLVITEIWRQPKEITSSSLKIGAKIPFRWSTNAGVLPDGVVLCYRRSFPLIESGSFQSQEEFYIWQGYIDNMTVEEFKKTCGL